MQQQQLVVTGRNAEGKSIFLDSILKPAALTFGQVPGLEVRRLWATVENPVIGNIGPETVPLPSSLVPAPGETRATQVTFPPDAVWEQVHDWEAVGVEYAAKLPGLAQTFEAGDPGMHTTPTVDYVILLAGELSLELDSGEQRHLKAGDVVVQNGTRHAWRNRSRQSATILAVLIGAVQTLE